MSPVHAVHAVLPEGIDDPTRPSGGNVYDRRVCDGLGQRGWDVVEHEVPGRWPDPDPQALAYLADLLAGVPSDTLVLLDGLVASAAPDVLGSEAARLHLVVLVHMPLGHAFPSSQAYQRERRTLTSARTVLTTSAWTRDWLLDAYGVPRDAVCVAQPGVEAAEVTTPDPAGCRLLCVGAVSRLKGHDVLLAAFATLRDLPWRLACVGSLDVDPAWVTDLRRQVEATGMAGRVCLAGPRIGSLLTATYAEADLLVLASRSETYGMVVTEALARGIPVVATAVGGVPEALGVSPGGQLPGVLVPAGDAAALADAVRSWLVDQGARGRLRAAARERRATLRPWSATTADVEAALLRGVAA